ncbi:MAG: hypothetical protein AAFN63_11340 [Pseudomonadota bacterium]
MSGDIKNILILADRLGAHLGITHWAVSMRVSSKGDFIHRLIEGCDLRTKTAARVMREFDDIWPDDLEWPSNIPRPEQLKEAAQ